jgi:hypothetical protein
LVIGLKPLNCFEWTSLKFGAGFALYVTGRTHLSAIFAGLFGRFDRTETPRGTFEQDSGAVFGRLDGRVADRNSFTSFWALKNQKSN